MMLVATPNEWMPLDASDETQLLGAIAQGRAIFTFNISDFVVLAKKHPHHAGIILAQQRTWPLARQIRALDNLLLTTTSKFWQGQVRWLNEWDVVE